MEDKQKNGEFSTNLLSLSVQMDGLFQQVGGEQIVKLLDILGSLTRSERDGLIESFLSMAMDVQGPKRESKPTARMRLKSGEVAKTLALLSGGKAAPVGLRRKKNWDSKMPRPKLLS